LNPIVVKGRLVDKSNKSIEGARVTLKLKVQGLIIGETTTNPDGYFSFSDWQNNPSVVGDYEIAFRFKGYEQFSETKIEKPNDDVDIGTIKLLRDTKSLMLLWSSIAAIVIIFSLGISYILWTRARTTEKYRSEHYPIWESQIENSLLTEGKASLKKIPRVNRAYASNQYQKRHSDFALFYDEKENSLRVNDPSQIEEFNNCWENAVLNLNANSKEQTKSFQESSTQIIHFLCDAMGFTVDDKSKRQYERLWACIVNAPILRTNIPSRFPFICFQQRGITNADIGNFRDILDIFEITNRFALIVFDDAERACQIFQESVFRGAFDFVFLDKDDSLNILIAKEPRRALMRSILEQIDLTAISPYVPAGPVPENMFFGREGEIKRITQELNNNNSVVIIGGRRIGKTSVLQRLRWDFMKPGSKWHPLYANLQIVENYEDFFEQIRIDWKFETKKDDYSPRQFYGLASDLAKQEKQTIVFLIDEVDQLLWHDVNNTNILFETFRALSQNKQCFFVFSGERVLNKQIHNPNSPLFNFCINIPLSYLDEKNATVLITEPMATMDVEIEKQQQVIEEIIDISSCHPRIIQYICDKMISLISNEQTRCITIEHLHSITDSSEFKQEFIETIWGRYKPLEKLLTLLMIDKGSGFTKSDIHVALNKTGVSVSEDDLADAINNLQINSVLQQSEEQLFAFKAKALPEIVKEVKNVETEIEQLKEEIDALICSYQSVSNLDK